MTYGEQPHYFHCRALISSQKIYYTVLLACEYNGTSGFVSTNRSSTGT